MISCVFDTNSIISAHLLSSSVARQAYDKAMQIGVLVYSGETLRELSDAFLRPKFDKYISRAARINAIEAYASRSYAVDVQNEIRVCRDPKDDKFLALAVDAEATWIVTGDKDLLVLSPFRGIPIVSPADFLRMC